jgi:hypothetical protein
MNIKVQLPDKVSANSMIESGIKSEGILTFHAYSQEMKARVLEMIAKGERVIVKPCEEPRRNGEWLEKPMEYPY